LDLREFRVYKAYRVCRDSRGLLVHKALKVSKALVFKALLVMFKDLKELRVDRELKALKVSRAQAFKVLLETSKVLKALRGFREHKVSVFKELKD
jgi:hypothetical protein